MASSKLRGVRIAWILATLFTLSACTSVGEHPAPPGDVEAARTGTKAAVLVRFVGEDQHGRAFQPLVPDMRALPLGLMIGDSTSAGVPTYQTFPEGSILQLSSPRYRSWVLSKESRDEGWLTLFLAPGYYYLGLDFGGYPPGSPMWRLEVLPDAPAIYAGTFHLSGVTQWDIGGPYLVRLDPEMTQIQDESELAKIAARRDLPSLPPPATHLVQRQSGPLILGIPHAAP